MPEFNIKELPSAPHGKTGWPWIARPSLLPDTMPDGSPWPKISIVTPSYNQGKYIESTIRSVILQGYPNLEYFIFDGASDDNTVEIIKKYEPWITFWVSEPDRGQVHAINKGFRRATGEILHWLNSDDILLEGALKEVALACKGDPESVAWVGNCERVTPTGKLLNVVEPDELTDTEIAERHPIFYQPACFINAKTMREIGEIDESLYMAFDFDLWLNLARKGKFAKIETVLARAVIHPEAKSQASYSRGVAERALVLFENGYKETAMRAIQVRVDAEQEYRAKAARITSLPGYRLIRPFLKMLGLAG